MSLSLGLGLALTRNKGGADALHGVQVQAARSPGRTFFRNGLRRSTALTDVATVTRATGGYGVTNSGRLVWFAAGVPRATDAGLTVEPAATNLLTYSDDYANAAWIKLTGGTGITPAVETDAVPGPFAGTADRVTFDLASGTGYNDYSLLYRNVNTGAGQFSRAVWLRSTTPSTILFADGLAGYKACTVTAAWTRFDLTSTLGGSSNFQIGLRGTFGSSDSATVEIWNSTLESGPIVTSPVVTTTATATRNADVITEAVNIPVGQAYTVTGKAVLPASGAFADYPNLFTLYGSDSSVDRLQLVCTPGNIMGVTGRSNGVALNGAYQAVTPGQPVGFALSVAGSTVTLSINGAAGVAFTLPGGGFAALVNLGLGRNPAGAQQFNSTIRDLNIVMRAYSAAELQAASDVSLTHDIDFVSQVYQYVGAPYVTPTDLPGTTFTRATSGTAMTLAGQTLAFAAGVLRVTDAGALFEAGTTQYIARSKRPGGTGWAINGSPTITPDFAVEADGATWTRIQTAVADGIYTSGVTAVVGSMCQSWRLKDNGGASKVVTLAVGGGFFGAGGDRSFRFNLTTGERTSVHADLSATGAVQLADGSWLVWCVFTATSAGPSATAVIYGQSGAVDFLVSRPQFEPGTYPSSSLVSDGATMTRNADVLASVNDNNPSAYTVVAEFTVPTSGPAYAHVWTYDDGNASGARSFVYYDRATGKLYAAVETGGLTQASLDLGVVTAGQTYKVAFAVSANDFAAIRSGGAIQTDTSGTVPSTTAFRIGRSFANGNEWGGFIQRIRRFSVRKTNSELQALVA